MAAVARYGSPVYAGQSPNGNEIVWTSGYPVRSTPLGTDPPQVQTAFGVTPASGWTPQRIDFNITRFKNADGTNFDGNDPHNIQANFSEVKTWSVGLAGKSVKVTSIAMRSQNNKTMATDIANETDSGVVVIRE